MDHQNNESLCQEKGSLHCFSAANCTLTQFSQPMTMKDMWAEAIPMEGIVKENRRLMPKFKST